MLLNIPRSNWISLYVSEKKSAMDPGEHSSGSPGRTYFDTASLLGKSTYFLYVLSNILKVNICCVQVISGSWVMGGNKKENKQIYYSYCEEGI